MGLAECLGAAAAVATEALQQGRSGKIDDEREQSELEWRPRKVRAT